MDIYGVLQKYEVIIMEDVKCKKLIATFVDEKLMLDGPKSLEIYIDDNISVKIEQMGIRVITVTSKQEESFRNLYGILTKVERLLMLFDGQFIKLKDLSFEESVEGTSEHLKSYAYNIMKTRLNYYKSADFCNYSTDKLVDYETTITPELYSKWQVLLDELDISHQMFLYSVSDNKIPIDVKCAFLIELAEPMVEIVKIYTPFFKSLKPGEKGTSLKKCIKAVISKFGRDIFSEEMSSHYNEFLQILVDSRVRIMHIKRKQQKVFLNGSESILYAKKMTLLYRKILFEILDINEEVYKDRMERKIKDLSRK